MNRKYLVLILTVLVILVMAAPVFAEPISVNAGIGTATDQNQLGTAIKDIVTKVGSLIGVIAISALIFNGFKLGTASNEQKRAEALSGIKWALVAVVIVGLAVMGVSFIASLVGGAA